MSTRYILKIVDFGLQVLSVLIPFVWSTVTGRWYYMFIAYLSLGVTQFLSCIVNRLLLPSTCRADQRTMYETILMLYTIVALLLFGLSLFIPYNHSSEFEYRMQNINEVSIFILIYTSPFLGIWYGILSFIEIRN